MLIFYQLLPLSLSTSYSRCRFWYTIIVVFISALADYFRSLRHQRLAIVAVLLLLAAVSLIVAASVGF